MPAPSFTSPPTAPSRDDASATFISRANAFLAWLVSFVPELETLVDWIVDVLATITSLGGQATTDAATATAAAATATSAALTAVNAPGTTATSTTSNSIANNVDKTFVTQSGKTIVAGMGFVAASRADPVNRMWGYIRSYSGTSLVLAVTQVSGAGTFTDWDLSLAAAPNIAGRHAMWFPASSLIPRSTNGATTGNVELASNKEMLRTLDFDAGTIEYAQFVVRMPKSWNEGPLTAAFVWSHAATTTNFKVSWGIQAVALGDNEAADVAFGTAIYANDTGGTTDRIYIGPETAAVTVAGAIVAEDLVVFQVLRKADDATNDTLAIDARLEGVTLYITTDAENDA